MKSISLFTGLLLLTATSSYAQQRPSQGGTRRADALGAPQQQFRTNEMENPRTLQTNVGPLFLIGMPPGLDEPENGVQLDGGDEKLKLSRSEKIDAARRIIRGRLPRLKDTVRINASPTGLLVASGRVSSLGDKLAVGRALVDVPGNIAVLNAIEVQPPRRDDEAIRRDVQRLLRADPELPSVRVQVNRQVVYFPSGAVPDEYVTQAVQRVANIRGVVDVLVGPLS